MIKDELIAYTLVNKGFNIHWTEGNFPITLIGSGTRPSIELGGGFNDSIRVRLRQSEDDDTIPLMLTIPADDLFLNISSDFISSIVEELTNGLRNLIEEILSSPQRFPEDYITVISEASVHNGNLTFNRLVLSNITISENTFIPEDTVFGRSDIIYKETIVRRDQFNPKMLELLMNSDDSYSISMGDDCIIIRKKKNK